MSDVVVGWLALLLVGGAAALWIRALRAVRLPANRTAYVVAWLGGIGLGVASLTGEPGLAGGLPAALAVAVGGFFCLTVAVSRQKVGAGVIAVGDSLPAFSAVDADGERFDSASLTGHPVLIKFFRGHW